MARCGDDAGRLRYLGVDGTEFGNRLALHHLIRRADNVVIAARAEHAVGLGELLQDFLLIALGKAAGDEKLLHTALGLPLAGADDVFNGLALGGVDEAAGVDDHQIGRLGRRRNPIAGLPEQKHHLLAVDVSAPAGRSRNIICSQSIWFLAQPREMNPTDVDIDTSRI